MINLKFYQLPLIAVLITCSCSRAIDLNRLLPRTKLALAGILLPDAAKAAPKKGWDRVKELDELHMKKPLKRPHSARDARRRRYR